MTPEKARTALNTKTFCAEYVCLLDAKDDKDDDGQRRITLDGRFTLVQLIRIAELMQIALGK